MGPWATTEQKRFPGLTLDMKVCDCAGCGRLLLSRQHETYFEMLSLPQQDVLPELVYERRDGRPYCGVCSYREAYGVSAIADSFSREPAAVRHRLAEALDSQG